MFRRIICLLVSMFVFTATTFRANITPLVDLTPDQLVGPWEALTQRDGICGPGIYQMVFASPKDAWLVEVSSQSGFNNVQFLGKLVSEDLANGQIKLEFTALQPPWSESDPQYVPVEPGVVSVQIQGLAYRSGDSKIIEGKIIRKRRDGKVTSDHVFESKRSVRNRSPVEVIMFLLFFHSPYFRASERREPVDCVEPL